MRSRTEGLVYFLLYAVHKSPDGMLYFSARNEETGSDLGR